MVGERERDGLGPKGGQSQEDRGRAEEARQVSGRRVEAQQVQVHLGRAGIPHVPGPPGLESPIASTQAVSVSSVQTQSVFLQH